MTKVPFMSNFISSLVASTDVTPEQQKITRQMLRTILIMVTAASSLVAVLDGFIYDRPSSLYAMLPVALLSLICLILLQRQVVWPSQIVIPLGVLVSISYMIWAGNGLHDIGVSRFGAVIVLAGLTLGGNGLIVFGLLAVMAVVIIGIAEINGFLPNSLVTPTASDIVGISIAILVGSFLLRLLLSRLRRTIIQLQQKEQEQSQANADLVELKESLERRVTERTTELSQRSIELEKANKQVQRRAEQFEALTQVMQSILSIRDLQKLLPQIAAVISDRFGFYHVGVFLVDEANEYAVLTAANSTGGQRMLARQHRLKVGEQGIVGSVTGTGEPRIALDVGADAVFFNNPDLPETRSEMALPLRSGNKIIGALDVQSVEGGAFTDEDVQTLSLLAEQVGLAIENARLFENSSRTLSELQMVMRQSTREAWKRLPEKQNLLGFRFNAMGATPIQEPVSLAKSGSGRANAKGAEATPFVVPIELRGEVIGKLVVQSPGGKEWGPDQQDLIRAVAERVALSAENARLFEETTQRAEREKLVSEITGKIRSHNDPQVMIETAIRELRNALGASRVDIIPQTGGGKESKV